MITKLRKQIDSLDLQLLTLINQRAELALRIAGEKRKKEQDTFAPGREAMIFRRVARLNKGPLSNSEVVHLFREIISVCRSQKVKLKVAFMGPDGTFTQLAAVNKFGKRTDFISCNSIHEVFERVEKEGVNYGVVPIENSLEGVVNYTLDMFLESELKICSESILSISHALLRVLPSKQLVRIYSHPQVFAQCRVWLTREFPQVELIPVATTAKAAEMAKKDSLSGCMGNKVLAEIYGLKIVKTHIEDSPTNATRFLVIGRHDSKPSGNDKTSILVSVKDKVGALYQLLASFKRFNINLTKIESRPSKRRPWEYFFFIDFQGHRTDRTVKELLVLLEKRSAFMKILGSYPREV